MTKAEGKGEVTDLKALSVGKSFDCSLYQRKISVLVVPNQYLTSAETGGGPPRNLPTIAFFAFSKVDGEQARRFPRLRRRRRVSGDLPKRLAGGLAAHNLVYPPALHLGIEHFQGSAAGVDLVIMSEIGEPFEDAEQVLVPGTVQDFQVAGAALRAERSEPRELVATLGSRRYGEAAEHTHQMKCLALTACPGSLPNPIRTRLPSCLAVLSNNCSTSPGLARARAISNNQ